MKVSRNILEADSIVVNYDERNILNNVYIRVAQGEIVGLLGRNGCGKSTLLNTIFGAIEATHKTIRINGVWTEYGHSQSRVMMLPQGDMIPGNIRLRQAMKLFGVEVSMIGDAMAGLVPFLDQVPSQLSGGERRAFELLLVLYSKSLFCLLDEPFTGLAPVVVERIIEIMQVVKKTKGILLTDHLHRSVTSCADRLYCFHPNGLGEVHPD